MQSERWANIGREILFSARSELYMNLPFLDGALAALPVQDGFETSSLATDAKALYFSGAWLAQRFERSRTSVNRAYLHTVFHCLLRHPAKMRGRDRDLWSLACDIAVESLLDSLDYRCLAPDKTSVRRRSLYRSLHEHMPVLTAEAVYRHFRRERMNSYDCATLTRVFAVDEHTLWPEDDDDQDRRWQQQAQRTQTAMDTVFASEATGGEAVREHNLVPKAEFDDYIDQVMDNCGLQPFHKDRYPHEFSGGQRQRICIARALALNPEFIVCDEPVSALDVSIQAQIINLLKDLQEKYSLTYLFISHDLSVVEHISDTVGVMYLGNLVEYGATDDIFRSPLHPYTKALFSAIPVPDPKAKMNRIVLEGSIPSPANPPKGCKFHTRCKYCTEICEQVVPEWKEVSENHFVACHHVLPEKHQ